MEIAIKAPTAILSDVCNMGTNVQMCVAHRILRDNVYAEFYKDESRYTTDTIIMDTLRRGLGHAMATSDVIRACKMICPIELILPNVFWEGPKTVASIEAFIEQIAPLHDYSWSKNFVVPQGRHREEWLACFDHLNELANVHVIGLSRTLDDIWYPGGRIGAALFLQATGRINIREKQYHALDVNDPLEVLSLATLGWIRSFDTTLPIDAGLQGIKLDRVLSFPMRQIKRQHNYFDVSESECFAAVDTIKHNISVLQEWCTPKEKQLNE